ncbi:MAG: DUF4270 domain-containing protein [Flavobacteriales bacterium]|nr:DUF4270 domain-containing protein [Flavobacteriales bacterium]
MNPHGPNFKVISVLRKAFSFSAKFLFLLFLTGFYACNKPTPIGLEVQPSQDQIGVYVSDTSTVMAYTFRNDSLRSDETSLALLGSYVDPEFGKAEASFYTQLRLPTANVDFGTNPVLDSVIFTLGYKGTYYGDTNAVQTVEIYEMTEAMHLDSNYYSNSTFQTDPTPIGTATLKFTPNTVVVLDTDTADTLAPHIRIALDPAFGQKILAESGGPNLADNIAFQEFLKGLYVKVNNPSQSTGDGCIGYFNIINGVSGIDLHYSNDDADSLVYPITIGSFAARSNHFEHDYTGTIVEQHINGTAPDTNLLYLSAMAGVSAKIELPFIENWANNPKRSINRVELVMTLDNGSDVTFPAPLKVQLVGLDSAGAWTTLVDDAYSSQVYLDSRYFGGPLQDDNTYHFLITLHTNRILSGEIKNNGMVLVVSGNAISGSRLILNGPQSPLAGSRMKLKVTYTEF